MGNGGFHITRVVINQWTVVSGQWSVVSGQWTVCRGKGTGKKEQGVETRGPAGDLGSVADLRGLVWRDGGVGDQL